MTQYYFLASVLPEIKFGDEPDISFYELEDLMHLNLSPTDFEKTKVIRRYYDLENIRSLWQGSENLDHYGNFNFVELEEALMNRASLPKYVFDFMDIYDNTKSRLEHFPELIHTFFSQEIAQSSGFLKQYLQFERDWRLILVAFRAKKLGRDVALELQYENPEDPIVAQILANKDTENYEPPANYQELKPIFEANQEDPLALHKALSEYRFLKIDRLLGLDFFSMGRILGYMIKLITVEKWLALEPVQNLRSDDFEQVLR